MERRARKAIGGHHSRAIDRVKNLPQAHPGSPAPYPNRDDRPVRPPKKQGKKPPNE
jgi:hypothetical protein